MMYIMKLIIRIEIIKNVLVVIGIILEQRMIHTIGIMKEIILTERIKLVGVVIGIIPVKQYMFLLVQLASIPTPIARKLQNKQLVNQQEQKHLHVPVVRVIQKP